jgi:phage host-nuclease inhibitor protein Gam
MAKRLKTKAVGPVPQNREQAREYILRIGQHQNDRKRIEAEMNDQIQKVRDKYQALAAPHAEQIDELSQGLYSWCQANRDALTNNGKRKSADLGAGEIGWRVTPPKISCSKIATIIESLKAKRLLKKYGRLKIEVNKDAILSDCIKHGDGSWELPDRLQSVPGLSVKATEEFYVEPHESELEEVA